MNMVRAPNITSIVMNKFKILLFALSFFFSCSLVCAQSLVTRKEFHDPAGKHVSIKWTEMADGTRHGKEQYFTTDGIITKEITWKNGLPTEYISYFLDKTVKWTGSYIGQVSNPKDYVMSDFASYRIILGSRVPEEKYTLIPTNLISENIKFLSPEVSAFLGNRFVSEFVAYAQGQPSFEYRLLSDNSTVAVSWNVSAGHPGADLSYDFSMNKLQIIDYECESEGWSIENGVVRVSVSNPEYLSGDIIYDFSPLDGKRLGSISMPCADFMKSIFAVAQTEDGYGSYLVKRETPFTIATIIKLLDINESDFPVIGRIIDGDKPQKAYKIKRDGNKDGVYRYAIDDPSFMESWSGTFKGDKMVYLETYLRNKDDQSTYTTRGEIRDSYFNGLVTEETKTPKYTIKSEGQYVDGSMFNGKSVKKYVNDEWTEETVFDAGNQSVRYLNEKTKSVYVGRVTVNDRVLLNGKGKIIKADGDSFEGYFIDGVYDSSRVGTVTLTHLPDSMIVVSEFIDGKLNGKGSLSTIDGYKFEGYFLDGAFSEVLQVTNPMGDVFIGQNNKGYPDGEGKCTFSNGDYYEGGWHGSLFTGAGELKLYTGEIWKGNWERGYCVGVFDVKAGNNTAQITVKDKLTGTIEDNAVLRFANGDSFEGELTGAQYSKGTYTFTNGNSAKLKLESNSVLKGKLYDVNGKTLKIDFSPSLLQPIKEAMVVVPSFHMFTFKQLQDNLSFPDIVVSL